MPQTRDTPPGENSYEPGRQRGGWKLEDAKARFSEVVRRAKSEGPQRVSVRGRDAVVVVAVDEFERPAAPNLEPAAVRNLHGEPVWRRPRPDTRPRHRPRRRALIGWLLDTNVVAEIIAPGGSQRVKTWAASQDEAVFT